MISTDSTIPPDRSLLHAAMAAMQQGNMQGADALFLQHLAQARDDVAGLANYGIFCLRTGRAATANYLLYKANALHPGDSDLLGQRGYAQVELRDFENARRAFEAALALAPGNPMASYGLALCEQHDGRWAAAARAFEQALSARSDAFPILLHLAEACHRAGDARMARAHFEQARRIAPDHPAMWLAYGRFLRELGEVAQAMQMVDRCVQLHPGEPRVILEKARCLRALGDFDQAMRWLERLEKIAPGLPENFAEYGDCLQAVDDLALREHHWTSAADLWVKSGEFALADALLDRLLAANPASAVGWNTRGNLENARLRLDAAEAAWRKAIEIDPALLDAPANLALLYESTNRLAEAKAIAESALHFIRAGEQRDGAIGLNLASCKLARRQKDYTRGLDLLDRIEAFGPTESQRALANFERGKIMDQLGDASHAIATFTSANALAHAAWMRGNPGKNKTLAGIEHMLDIVGKGWLRQWKPVGELPDTMRLAFLVGFPRSGTTLLNQVLDSHSAIQAVEEKPLVQKIMDAVRGMPREYPHAIPDFDALDIAFLRDAYFRAAAEHGASDPSKLLLDKFPMHITLAGLLHRVFPQARFVFAVRHPCDVVLSCFMQDFALNNTMANFCSLADSVALYTKTMDLWQAYREQLPLNVHAIRYEDVVDDFDGQVRSLCGFLEVPWEDDLEQFAARALDRGRINTPSYEQVSRPIYREARYRWERYREHLAPYLPALRPYIERFDYADSAPTN